MPIYDYKCKKCTSRFEMKKGYNEPHEAICPQCQGEAQLVFHPAPIIFKGSGFYVTDHKANNSAIADNGNGKGKAADIEKTKPSESGKKDESKSSETVATPTSSEKSGK